MSTRVSSVSTSTLRRVLIWAVAAIGALAFSMGGTSAAPPFPTGPETTPNGKPVDLVCEELGILTVQFYTRGEWFHAAEPRLVVDGVGVLVAYSFYYKSAYTDGTTDVDIAWAKPAPANGRLDTCRMTVSDSWGSFTATYGMSYTPKAAK